MTTEMNERDVVATDEMIRNLRAGTFRKIATGVGICGALLLVGASLLVWTWKHGNDPEALKEALRHMPPLSVTVTLDPASKVSLAEGGMVKLDPASRVTLADGGTVRLEQPSVMPRTAAGGGSHDPAIQETVTVFKTVKSGNDMVRTGWDFANGAARTPERQFCYFQKATVDGNWGVQDVGRNGNMLPAPNGVTDQRERFAKCQWFSGDFG